MRFDYCDVNIAGQPFLILEYEGSVLKIVFRIERLYFIITVPVVSELCFKWLL